MFHRPCLIHESFGDQRKEKGFQRYLNNVYCCTSTIYKPSSYVLNRELEHKKGKVVRRRTTLNIPLMEQLLDRRLRVNPYTTPLPHSLSISTQCLGLMVVPTLTLVVDVLPVSNIIFPRQPPS